MSKPGERPAELAALDVLVGECVEQVILPDAPAGRAVFEWTLGAVSCCNAARARSRSSRTAS